MQYLRQRSEAPMTRRAIDLDQAKLDPGSVFRAPEEVLSAELSAEDKRAILVRWEADTEALLRATEEGMPPSDKRSPAELLRVLHEAMRRLEGRTA
jgi:hypothetical protein